jgi:hypothetical protein
MEAPAFNGESCMRTYSVDVGALVALIASTAFTLLLLALEALARLGRVSGWGV